MAGVRAMIRKLQAVRQNLPIISEEAVAKTTPEYVALNKEQLLEGYDRKGNSLGRYKNPAYEAKKRAMNPKAQGRKDYKLYGDYYRGIFAVVDNGRIRMGSTDEKAPFLQPLKGDDRFGLDPDGQERYIGILRPVMKQEILDTLKIN